MGDAELERLSGASASDERLRRLLGDPALEWLLARVRRRIELSQPLEGVVTLAQASSAQRRAAQRLLGRPPRAGSALSVSLQAVDEVLRSSGVCADGLAAAVVALTGPVFVRADALAVERLAWEHAFAPLSELVSRLMRDDAPGGAELALWLERLRASGQVKRAEADPQAAQALLGDLAAVLEALPADGQPLAGFAARVAGGAHALDDGRPLAALALGAVRALAKLASPGPDESHTEARREAWASVGLLCDELSSLVLALGLPGEQRTASGRILGVAQDSGQPVWLTLRQLVRDMPRWTSTLREGLSGQTVYVCENPIVVAVAADRHGSECAPLVCTNGQPGAATMLLLRALGAAGARLVHHGDFDWGGMRIGNVLHRRLSLEPWQFDTEAYLRAADAATPSQPLVGTPVHASWDPHLSETMRSAGRRIEEELVLDWLLADLAPR